MRLLQSDVFRLYGVSDVLNEEEEYPLESFGNDAFNEDIDAGGIDEALNGLADVTYGNGSRWFEITDDMYDGKGKVCIEINDDDRLEVRDLTDKVDTDSERSRFYILADAQLSEYCWVVAEPKGTVYSG